MRKWLKDFLISAEDFPKLSIFAAGLYPFLHYFNSNLHIANSWVQLGFMISLCFVIPLVIQYISKLVFKWSFLKRFESRRLTIINLAVFGSLFGFLVFDFKKKATVLVLIIAFLLAYVLYKHLKKIIVIQLLLAAMSAVTLVPLLNFALRQDNADWAKVSNSILETKFKVSPNIFVIQPDGYVNQSELENPPYNFDNSNFYNFLNQEGFRNYQNFRSNYFSTLTSNSSMFAMKHHNYQNTYNRGHKTFNANKVIVGRENNVLKIFKYNNYTTHLISDNSYFSIDRVPVFYDYHNSHQKGISFIKSGTIPSDVMQDLDNVLDSIQTKNNFFFIEKIAPSHIVRNPSQSKGIKGERDAYIDRLKTTNDWLKDLITRIHQFDKDALIIIVADHGGFVGLNHTLESVNKPLNPKEIKSVFSAILSIKWPKSLSENDEEFNSNVNLFRSLFYVLSGNQELIESTEPNTSYIPYYESSTAKFYKCIDDNGEVILYGNRN